MAKTRVLLVDDHPIFREGVRSRLERHEGVEVVGEAADGEAAIRLATQLKPDILLTDIELPQINGLDLVRLLGERAPKVQVVLLSMHSNREFVRQALRVGVRGYVVKSAPSADLVQAIEAVERGGVYFSAEVAQAAMGEYLGDEGDEKPKLTKRERQVLGRVAAGRLNKEIAAELGISVRTVESHRERIMKKLDLHTVAELTRYAMAEGVAAE